MTGLWFWSFYLWMTDSVKQFKSRVAIISYTFQNLNRKELCNLKRKGNKWGSNFFLNMVCKMLPGDEFFPEAFLILRRDGQGSHKAAVRHHRLTKTNQQSHHHAQCDITICTGTWSEITTSPSVRHPNVLRYYLSHHSRYHYHNHHDHWPPHCHQHPHSH